MERKTDIGTPEYNGRQSAFPTDQRGDYGMSKREEIAARVLAGIVANSRLSDLWGTRADDWATSAVKAADALLRALDR